ncbi:MAG TPA: glycosyltransferase family 4 protein [Vicinamibacterales bacterium]|nr:glycosyltransferase family 4 protein [Vicinamibacterales bacterium]
MRICFFNRSYWPDQAATGQLLTELAEDLVAQYDDQVTVVAGRALHGASGHGAPRRAISPVTREERRGVVIRRANGTRMRPRRFAARAANYVSYFAAATVASVGIGRPDVVVSLTDPPIVGMAALWAARRAGSRFVFLCEDIFPEVGVLVEDFRSELVNASLDRMNRYLLAQADAVVALGERMRSRLVDEKGADPRRLHVIHNWADCHAIVPGPKDNPFSRAHGLVDRFVVMHSGNVGLSQNLEVLIAAADRLRGRERLIITIVGDGAKREALEHLAADRRLDNVRFLPYQPKELLHDSFGAADAFVVSLQAGLEGFIVPSKLYGILAAGRAYVAATDPSCEPATIAAREHCGIVAAPGDPDALAAAIATLHDDPQATRAMGERARRAAWQYDRRVAVRAYRGLFAHVCRIRRVAA